MPVSVVNSIAKANYQLQGRTIKTLDSQISSTNKCFWREEIYVLHKVGCLGWACREAFHIDVAWVENNYTKPTSTWVDLADKTALIKNREGDTGEWDGTAELKIKKWQLLIRAQAGIELSMAMWALRCEIELDLNWTTCGMGASWGLENLG